MQSVQTVQRKNKAIEASSETVHNLKRASKKGQNGKDGQDTNRKWIRKCQLELCNTNIANFTSCNSLSWWRNVPRSFVAKPFKKWTSIKCASQKILSLDLALEQTPLITKLVTKFPAVFDGTGKLDGPNYLEIESDAILVVHPPRKVPIALKPLLKKELQRLHDVGILAPVTEPTP